jgi:hypothetical protein
MSVLDPDSYPARIPDPAITTKREVEKFVNVLFFNRHRKIFADPGWLSRIRLFFIPDPGSELSPSRIRIKEFKYFNQKEMVFKL